MEKGNARYARAQGKVRTNKLIVAVDFAPGKILASSPPDVPLRPLEAQHLKIAKVIDVTVLATSDLVMADGSRRMWVRISRFV